MSPSRKSAALICAIGLLAALSAAAEEWPSRVVKFVPPYAPGSDSVAKRARDGYTYVFIFDTHTVHQSAYALCGILAPAGTPKPITLTERLGMEVAALSPEATGKNLGDAMERRGKVGRDNPIVNP